MNYQKAFRLKLKKTPYDLDGTLKNLVFCLDNGEYLNMNSGNIVKLHEPDPLNDILDSV